MKPGFNASPDVAEEGAPPKADALPELGPGSVTVAPRDPVEGATPLVAADAPAGDEVLAEVAALLALGAAEALGAVGNGVGTAVVICGGATVGAAAAG